MKDCLFKRFVIDTYKEFNNPKRIYHETVLGKELTFQNFFGMIYNAVSTDSFSDVTDIQKYMDIANPDMVLLRSRVTNQEVEVYSWKLLSYEIKEDSLLIDLGSKVENFML